MEVLLELAKQNRTVICSIHQPRSDIFNMFDMVMLLSKGQIVYFGTAKEMVPYFSKLNFTCPTEQTSSWTFHPLITFLLSPKRTPENKFLN
mmetsp:Transcript_11941/g.16550  ORF Transcript_11941/g.16550 Transcript_11941/m.16550 type:complete len:91 (+) Transcript_11941:553-825(+)